MVSVKRTALLLAVFSLTLLVFGYVSFGLASRRLGANGTAGLSYVFTWPSHVGELDLLSLGR